MCTDLEDTEVRRRLLRIMGVGEWTGDRVLLPDDCGLSLAEAVCHIWQPPRC
jgi:hypothetical protein